MLQPLGAFSATAGPTHRDFRKTTVADGLDNEFANLKEAKTIRLVGKELVEDTYIALPA